MWKTWLLDLFFIVFIIASFLTDDPIKEATSVILTGVFLAATEVVRLLEKKDA